MRRHRNGRGVFENLEIFLVGGVFGSQLFELIEHNNRGSRTARQYLDGIIKSLRRSAILSRVPSSDDGVKQSAGWIGWKRLPINTTNALLRQNVRKPSPEERC